MRAEAFCFQKFNNDSTGANCITCVSVRPVWRFSRFLKNFELAGLPRTLPPARTTVVYRTVSLCSSSSKTSRTKHLHMLSELVAGTKFQCFCLPFYIFFLKISQISNVFACKKTLQSCRRLWTGQWSACKPSLRWHESNSFVHHQLLMSSRSWSESQSDDGSGLFLKIDFFNAAVKWGNGIEVPCATVKALYAGLGSPLRAPRPPRRLKYLNLFRQYFVL